ncbi:MAG: cellobiose phosphorylase, partial [Lapillicoccus sp.]
DGVVLTPPAGSAREQTYPGATVALSWTGTADTRLARDEPLFADGRSRDLPWVTLATDPVSRWSLTLRPRLVPDEVGADAPAPAVQASETAPFWTEVGERLRLRLPAGTPAAADPVGLEVARLDAVLPWFAHDALVHYLSPRGLEQYTGGGWGTRDVSQGPVGLLVAFGEHEALRDVVVRLLRAQHARGDWPQAFDFYARHRSWQVSDAHGDVVYWPLLAIGDYLVVTGDDTLLAQAEPMVADGHATEPRSLLDHLERALDLVEASRIPGTTLPAYGHGDWNDSLQPADPALAAALCSTWTVTLQAHALRTLAAGLEPLPSAGARGAAVAGRARRIADEGVAAMRESLLVDDVLAGYGRVDHGAVVEHLIHPRDRRTGLTYSVLPMIHAVSADLLTPEEAHHHLALIHTHLTGPDGVRLFDRPAAYHGGPMEVFQRAEASTFFGREIGIMYTHAHLRYAEALARMGDGPGLLAALARVNPVGMPERVGSARLRQSTTYFSSSDAAFHDRETAGRDYGQVRAGTVALEGGWRVYSSGPGLYLRLVRECLLGIRERADIVEIDPVLPPALDGLTATVHLFGRAVEVAYRMGAGGCGPVRVSVGGQELAAQRLDNPYRTGGLSVQADELRNLLGPEAARIDVEVS